MADTKITALSALTGANLATGDQAVVVDVSDTTLAASGTDKKISADELAAGVQLLRPAQGVEPASRGLSGSLASTFDRAVFQQQNGSVLTSAQLAMVRICLPKGLSVTSIAWCSATTALGTGVNQWFALFDSSRNKLAITGDDTSTAWAANTMKTLTVTGGPFVTTYAGWYYVGCMVKATTVPTIASSGVTMSTTHIRGFAPIPFGLADSGLTNPASCPTTTAALTAQGTFPYAEIS